MKTHHINGEDVPFDSNIFTDTNRFPPFFLMAAEKIVEALKEKGVKAVLLELDVNLLQKDLHKVLEDDDAKPIGILMIGDLDLLLDPRVIKGIRCGTDYFAVLTDEGDFLLGSKSAKVMDTDYPWKQSSTRTSRPPEGFNPMEGIDDLV